MDPLSEEGWKQKPNLNAIRSLEAVIRVHSKCGDGTLAELRLRDLGGTLPPRGQSPRALQCQPGDLLLVWSKIPVNDPGSNGEHPQERGCPLSPPGGPSRAQWTVAPQGRDWPPSLATALDHGQVTKGLVPIPPLSPGHGGLRSSAGLGAGS